MPTEITPDMSLPLPVVGEQDGPEWAENLNSCLTIIDGHTHTSGSGVPITPDAIDINSDVAFNDNNATSLRTSRYTSQSAPLALPADLACVYVVAGELYYNDLDGNQVKLTEAGSPAGATGTITGLPSGTASASFAGSTFTWSSATNTPASMNQGPTKIRQATANGYGVTVSAAGAQAADYALTLPSALPSVASLLRSDTSGNLSFFPSGANIRASEGAGTVTLTISDNNYQVFNTSAAVVCVLPSTGVVAGQRYRIENVGSAGTLEVQSSDASNLCYVNSLYSSVELIALQASPTTEAHWKVDFSYNRFTYVSGTTYFGGGSPTFGGSGISSSVAGYFTPYQALDGTWRVTFNGMVNRTSGSSIVTQTVTVSQLVFKNVSGFRQAFACGATNLSSEANWGFGYAEANTSNLVMLFSSNNPLTYFFSGDVQLESKPGWAY
jgi:hypothetical protein